MRALKLLMPKGIPKIQWCWIALLISGCSPDTPAKTISSAPKPQLKEDPEVTAWLGLYGSKLDDVEVFKRNADALFDEATALSERFQALASDSPLPTVRRALMAFLLSRPNACPDWKSPPERGSPPGGAPKMSEPSERAALLVAEAGRLQATGRPERGRVLLQAALPLFQQSPGAREILVSFMETGR